MKDVSRILFSHQGMYLKMMKRKYDHIHLSKSCALTVTLFAMIKRITVYRVSGKYFIFSHF